MSRLRKLIVKFLMDSYKERYFDHPAEVRLQEAKDYEEFFLEVAETEGNILEELKGMMNGMPKVSVPNDSKD